MLGPIEAYAFVLRGKRGQCGGGQDASFTGITSKFVDNNGNTVLDYAVVSDRFEIVRLSTSMGAQVNSLSLSKSHAMEARLKKTSRLPVRVS